MWSAYKGPITGGRSQEARYLQQELRQPGSIPPSQASRLPSTGHGTRRAAEQHPPPTAAHSCSTHRGQNPRPSALTHSTAPRAGQRAPPHSRTSTHTNGSPHAWDGRKGPAKRWRRAPMGARLHAPPGGPSRRARGGQRRGTSARRTLTPPSSLCHSAPSPAARPAP